MAKMKSHRGAGKRFRRTAKGRWVHSKANRSHLARKKTPKRKRQLRRPTVVGDSDFRRIERLLPY